MSSDDAVWIAAVEGGGTSFRVAICQLNNDKNSLPTVLYRTEIDSSQPTETVAACAQFLKQHRPATGYRALGVATFGPVGLRKEHEDTYGHILESSPKAVWRKVDVLTPLCEACQGSQPLAVRVDTDVNAPALAEYLQVKQQQDAAPEKNNEMTTTDITSLAYVTIGTGVGVGLVVNGQTVKGRMHPEGGHVPVAPLEGDTFGGYSWGAKCPFQGKNTVEGLASSVALTERLERLQPTGSSSLDRSILATLPDDHEVWDHAANAIANLCVTLCLTVSIEKIVLGGGIMKRQGLLKKVQQQTKVLLNGYLPDMSEEELTRLIVTSSVGDDAGLRGAIVLAQRAFMEDSNDVQEEEAKEREMNMKRTAFGVGLWHGFLVGAVCTALVCKYAILPRAGKR